MSDISIAFNRFGLGARADDYAPADPKRWVTAQFDRFDPRPAAIVAAPARTEVARQLADYMEEVRSERRLGQFGLGQGSQQGVTPAARPGPGRRRQAGMQPAPVGDAMQESGQANMQDNLAGLPDSARRFIRQTSRGNYVAMIEARTNAALTGPAPFLERMSHFWANHFAVSADKLTVIGLAGLLEFEAIRPHVLGKFSDMLLAVEQHPAMLLYLDQAQSIGPNSQASAIAARFGRPQRGLNENLGREILELHTLGADGGYSQADVTEFARALTGWTVNGITRGPVARFTGATGAPGNFFFADRVHEPGNRTILGRSYAQSGEGQARAILSDLAGHPHTERHLSTKLARHFAGDDPPQAMVDRLTRVWQQSGGDLPAVYRAVIASPEAWAPTPAKFRNPWDWSLAALRAVGSRQVEGQAAAGLLTQLGQPAWRPGSPAGYDDIAPSWAGPDALMRRVEAAERIAARTGGMIDARQLGPRLLPGGIGEATAQAISHAESPEQGLALLLVAPEFLRR